MMTERLSVSVPVNVAVDRIEPGWLPGADGHRARARRGEATTVMSRPIVTLLTPMKRAVELPPTLSPRITGEVAMPSAPTRPLGALTSIRSVPLRMIVSPV